jgi:hypothetical protein
LLSDYLLQSNGTQAELPQNIDLAVVFVEVRALGEIRTATIVRLLSAATSAQKKCSGPRSASSIKHATYPQPALAATLNSN